MNIIQKTLNREGANSMFDTGRAVTDLVKEIA